MARPMTLPKVVTIKMDQELLARLDAWCRRNGVARSLAIREAVRQAMERESPSKPQRKP